MKKQSLICKKTHNRSVLFWLKEMNVKFRFLKKEKVLFVLYLLLINWQPRF